MYQSNTYTPQIYTMFYVKLMTINVKNTFKYIEKQKKILCVKNKIAI